MCVNVEINLVRNPKTGKGWVYNLTDNVWMRAINPQFSKNGTVVKGTYALQEGKKYLVLVDESSWSNRWETYQILTVENGQVKVLATFNRDNGTYKFNDDGLKRAFVNYSLTLPTSGSSPNETVKVNVLEFAKYLAGKI